MKSPKKLRPTKLLARYVDLTRIGIPVRELRAAILDGRIPVVCHTPGGQKRFCMRSALKLAGFSLGDGLIPSQELMAQMDAMIAQRLESLPGQVSHLVDQRLIERKYYFASGQNLETQPPPPSSAWKKPNPHEWQSKGGGSY